MYLGIPGPLPERLSEVPEDDSRAAEEGDQTHVGHNRWNVATLLNPRSNKFGESITPDVLVDSDGYEDRACDRLVGINGVRGGDGWESSHLYASAGIANDHDDLLHVSLVPL